MIDTVPAVLKNTTFDELTIGQTASLTRRLTRADIALFAAMSGDVNPAHLDDDYAATTRFHEVIAHGMWAWALISTVLGTLLPGPGTIYLEQQITFHKPVHVGDKITVRVTVETKHDDQSRATLRCECTNEHKQLVADGMAVVLVPKQKISMPAPALPRVMVDAEDWFQPIIESCAACGPLAVAVVHPVQADDVQAVAEAAQKGLITPTLVGPKGRMMKAAQDAGIDISAWTLVDTEHSHAAADEAARLASTGKVSAVMKGSLHTDELMQALLTNEAGLKTERRVSHVYIMDIPTYHKPLMITDAAINIQPNLEEKADICRNAVNLWRALYGDGRPPKIAVLAAVETVTSRMQATLDAAALCKMADRGQIAHCIIDGPLALDNAISYAAARDKNIQSPVAGDADILVVPDIEAGNMLAKQLTFLGQAEAAGIVLGLRIPVILTSRADTLASKIASCALAVRLAAARRAGVFK